MNIFGTNLYSKAIQGIRQQNKLKDQHLQVVYIYPIFVDVKSSKFSADIATFISTNMLKEIFINNSLNLINVASSVKPMNTDSSSSDVQSFGFGFGGGNQQQKIKPLENHTITKNDNFRHETQQRITEKTKEILSILTSDPFYKQYDPQLKMITMDNYVDVPVIIGTKQMQLEHSMLFLFLLIAVIRKIELTSLSNIMQICSIMETLTPTQFYNMLYNIEETPNPEIKESFFKYFMNVLGFVPKYVVMPLIRGAEKKYPELRSNRKALSNSLKQSGQIIKDTKALLQGSNSVDLDIEKKSAFTLLQYVKSNLGVFRSNWVKCFDADKRSQEFGVPSSNNTMSGITEVIHTDLQKEMEKLFYNIYLQYSNNLKYEIISVASVFYSTIKNTNDTYNDATDLIHDNILPALDKHIFDDIAMLFKNVFDTNKTVTDAKNLLISINSKGRVITNDLENILVSANKTNTINNEVFSANDYLKYVDRVRDLNSEYIGIIDSYNRLFREFFGKVNYEKIVTSFQSIISNQLSIIIPSIASFGVGFNYLGILDKNKPGTKFDNKGQYTLEEQFSSLSILCLSMLSNMATSIFFSNLHTAIMSYINVLDVSIDLATTEATDSTNYTLVIPEEIIDMISNIVYSYNWKRLISDQRQVLDKRLISYAVSNNKKRLVEYISNILKIPNIFVLGSSKEDPTVLYKLMTKSAICTTKISTIKSYNELNKAQNEPQPSRSNFY